MSKFRLFIILIFSLGNSAYGAIKVIKDGVSIQKPGVFNEGCYYGKDESISDHAPVIYNNFGTWNVTAPVSNFAIRIDPKSPVFFFNHKFRTNDQGILVDRNGTSLGVSEVVLQKKAFSPAQIKRNLANIKNKLKQAYKSMIDVIKIKNISQEEKANEIAASNKLRILSQEEINNASEKKYTDTIKILEFLQDNYSAISDQYFKRMAYVAAEIKDLFDKNKDLNYIVLQEIPNSNEKTSSGENPEKLLRDIFETKEPVITTIKKSKRAKKEPAKNLEITFLKPDQNKIQTLVSASTYKKNMIPDVAIVSRAGAPKLIQESADHDNRLVPWCSKATKSCFVSAHVPYVGSDEELVTRCKDIKNMAEDLKEKGFININIAGDFNISATKISQICKDTLPIADGTVELHTSLGEKGNSCGSNEGHVGRFNIDIMIKYSF